MSLSCRCMSTPNGASPSARTVISKKFLAPQRILDVADVVDEVARMLTLEDLAIAATGTHGDREVAERVGGGNVGVGVADDHARVVVGHRPADQPGLLERRIDAGRIVFDGVEKWRECKHRELRAERRR